MLTKWNQFVYLLCEAKKKNIEENDYHPLIEQQLQSYMRQLKLSVGIYIGEHIEVFYDTAGSKDAVSVLRIPLELNNNEGALVQEAGKAKGQERSSPAIQVKARRWMKSEKRKRNKERRIMAKKKKIIGEHRYELVANSSQSEAAKPSGDHPDKVVTNCDNQQFAVTIGDHKNIDIKSMIRVIRGQQVMLDFELATLYGVETKALNQAVKRNTNRFPEDFMFQLTKNELESLRSQIVTSNSTEKQQDINWKSQIVTSNPSNNDGANILISQNVTSNFAKMGLRRPPYAFTRNGIGMLSSVLRSETAVGVNILIMRAFTAIPQIVNQNVQMVQRIFNIEQHQMETDEKIEMILDKIEEIAPKQLPEQIFQTGCVWDAWAFVSELVRSAKKRIELIDNFVDDRVLSLLIKRGKGVSATIHSRFTKDFLTDLEKHNKQYEEVKFVQLPHKNHDRFLIIDDSIYLLGASVKDMGNGLCAVTKLTATPETVLGLLK